MFKLTESEMAMDRTGLFAITPPLFIGGRVVAIRDRFRRPLRARAPALLLHGAAECIHLRVELLRH